MEKMQMPICLALLAEEHLPEVAELERLCFSEPWSLESLHMLTADGAFGVVLTVKGEVAAYGGMTVVLDEGAVTNIAVRPELRRRGFGRAVTEELLREASRRGIRSVFLEVRESNIPAHRLYEKLGFRKCGIRKNFYRRPTEHAVQMVWTDIEMKE